MASATAPSLPGVALAQGEKPPFRPVLPITVAKLVSITALSAHAALRLTDDIGQSGLAAARHLVKTSCIVSRDLTEQLFVQLWEDVTSDHPELVAQAGDEAFRKHFRDLSLMFDLTVARALTQFSLTTGWLWMLSKRSKVLVSALNQVFGATEASCAVANLLDFFRREFGNPATCGTGETVSNYELGMAIVALIYLQGASRAWLRRESALSGVDEIIWDVLVFASGKRADVHEQPFGGPVVPASDDGQPESHENSPTPTAASPASPGSGDGTPPPPSPLDSLLASAGGTAPASPPTVPKKVGRLRSVLNTSMSAVRTAVSGTSGIDVPSTAPVSGDVEDQPPLFAGLSQRPTLRPRQNSSGGCYFSVHGSGEQPIRSIADVPTAGGAWRTAAPSLAEMLDELRRTGRGFHGVFVERHLLGNLARFMRFALASYGSTVLQMTGSMRAAGAPRAFDDIDKDVLGFALHTDIPPGDVLLSSLVDPQVGRDQRRLGGAAVPVVHYLSLDHASHAVVLTCRGTLGVQELITDFAADYEDFEWLGNTYKVHKGVYACAKHILYGGNGKLLRVLRAALKQYTGYGLVLVGHSLGGAVASLLGIMLAQRGPSPIRPFVTTREPLTNFYPNSDAMDPSVLPPPEILVPPRRHIHVYAYGPPACVSPRLREASRGLITTVVFGDDVIPFLSLGMFHGFQGAALALKTQSSEVKEELWNRAWDKLNELFINHYRPLWARKTRAGEMAEGEWAYPTLKILRASMMNDELVPPGEVFVLEETSVAARDKGMLDRHLGAPAFKLVLRYVWEVEKRFGEVRFHSNMFTDHGPERYEKGLRRLMVGVRGHGNEGELR